MSDNNLSAIFDLTTKIENDDLPVPVETGGVSKLPEDFDKARSNLLDLVNSSMKSVSELSRLASQSQNARMYEALTAATRAAVEANKTILDIHNTVREAGEHKQNQQLAPQSVTNQLFISTADLQSMISQATEKVIDVRPNDTSSNTTE